MPHKKLVRIKGDVGYILYIAVVVFWGCVNPICLGVKTMEGVEPTFFQGGKIKIYAGQVFSHHLKSIWRDKTDFRLVAET